MDDTVAAACAALTELVGDQADEWDRQGRIPESVVREASRRGLLCAQVGSEYGGLGLNSRDNGELTAHIGSLCSSLRSLMTSQGMAAWTIQRFGNAEQRRTFLPRLTGGAVIGVAFSEAEAGSDLSGIRTEIRRDGDAVRVHGSKIWTTGGTYADLLAVFGTCGDGAAVILVPTDAPGVRVERLPDPMGCRAAGHADVHLDDVRLPAGQLLGGAGMPLAMLATSALTYGRLSVAWGCAGILRACLDATTRHAKHRVQFGKPLAEHQLVARYLAELSVSDQVARLCCASASACWDEGSPQTGTQAVLAKYVAAKEAVKGAASAVQVLASRGAQDGHPVARAYRDAKLMEIIEGSTEISQLLLAEHALLGSI
ncbi:acyl-CoA dehydrogenase family protein [Streptomyces sp. ME19-01-6]|uniref:acyl-CoA dehydrogenase family protein n=1 Tax=Streptomyces sp. ME19-01-6 TaxID=3028686 RepID=UPI0029A72451|nr:acyl-CoA dehydrogenase family protein [Streptomyces sp. ME19-01-6]MDX3229142.1 acyl-CoA dehydrogenase family protein [Streptomyces sp. ME19-01-6]